MDAVDAQRQSYLGPPGFSSFNPHLFSPEDVPSAVRVPVACKVASLCISQKQIWLSGLCIFSCSKDSGASKTGLYPGPPTWASYSV